MVPPILPVPDRATMGFRSVNPRPSSAPAQWWKNELLLLTALLSRTIRRHGGTAAAANTASIRICNCHDGLIANDNSPTSNAASPSQNRNTPGASNSSAISTTPKISQFQVPSVENISVIVWPSTVYAAAARPLSHRVYPRWASLWSKSDISDFGWERVGVREYGLSLGRNPSPGSQERSDLSLWER